MRFATGTRLVVSLLVSCALVVCGTAGASAAKPASSGAKTLSSGQSAVAAADTDWGAGVEAALPANAAPTHQSAEVSSISCPSVGNCSAVGHYDDSSGTAHGLLLTETAGSWAIGVEPVPPANANPTNPGVSLSSISCASPGNCSAVGSYADSSGHGEGLLLSETAGSWSVGVEAVLPAHPASSYPYVSLGSVSCASAGNCTAVGTYDAGSPGNASTHGLLLTETAGSWATGVDAVLPADAATPQQVNLLSVSCASAGNCSAVGRYSSPDGQGLQDRGLLLTETGGSWGPGVEAVLPAGAKTSGQDAGLTSVSCASAGNCTAVGLYDAFYVSLGFPPGSDELRGKGLLLTETAGTWASGVEAALPAGADGPDAVDWTGSAPVVSCPSAGNCSAVAHYYDTSGGVQGLLLSENAGSWATGVEALPANSPGTYPGGNWVSCASPGNCGALMGGNLLTETAGSWATGVEPSLPPNAGGGDWLSTVSCPSAGSCTAVGSYPDNSNNEMGLLIGGSPASVKLDISTSGTGSGTVSSVPAGIDCGSTCSASFDAGTSLTLTATPSPGSTFLGWSGGGCRGTGSCRPNTGIGEQTVTATFSLPVNLDVSKSGTGSGTVSSVPAGIDCGSTCSASFDAGTSLTLTATPSPGSRFSGWSGGGCAGTGSCQMNDVVSDQTVTATFTVAGASGGWGVGIEAALPANAATTNQSAQISSISCASFGNCSAVGSYTDSSGNTEGLLMTETAGLWTTGVEAVLPPNANPSRGSALETVSCASAGNCTAVGTYEDNSSPEGATQGLLLTETADSWSAGVEAALPVNASASPLVGLRSVSCALAGNCTAVGLYRDSLGNTQGLLLTETGGRWAAGVEATPPAYASQSAVLSVSCASAGNCTAVGDYDASQGLLLTETGGSWARGVEAPSPNAGTVVTSVSCSSPGNCSAVGSSGAQALLLSETGGKWAKGVVAVLPANAVTTNTGQLVVVRSVSCASPGYCSAVGTYYDDANTIQGLLLTETAGTWARGVEALPANPEGAPDVSEGLTSVSCASPGTCSAVGTYIDSTGHEVGLLLNENAGSWATGVEASLPANAKPTSSLESISCTSPGNCIAAGDYYTADTVFGSFYVAGLLIGESSPVVKLEISKSGTGSGTVSDLPVGIRCGSSCSASFVAGASLTLTATPSPGSRFSGWSGGGCSGTGSCRINDVVNDQAVTATFSLLPRCVVPKLKGRTLKAAEHAITGHNCTVGKIKRAASRTIQKGHVISQRPKPGRRLQQGAKVSLVVSRGRR